jgi:hypothetical protein
MGRPRPNSREAEWQRRLFGVACDAEEAERWLEAFCIFQHLMNHADPDAELRLRIARVALHLGELGVAEEQSFEIDRLMHHDPALQDVFRLEAAALRFKIQKLAWDQYATNPSDLD